jgi:drug/metabolite transporter (DMT)-like permease
VIYLALVSSIIALVAYYWLLGQMPAALVGTYAYVNPVVAVLLGWLIADEIISFLQLSGMIVILCGAVLINFPKYKALFVRKRAPVSS